MNMTILERTWSMRIHTGLPKQFWADAINTAVYLINRGPSVPLNCGIPKEIWIDKEVNLNHLYTFGYIYYVHIELSNRNKLDPKPRRCIFIGYRIDEYGYRFWGPENRKILRHKEVVSTSRRRTKTCRDRGAPRRMILGWHLRALPSSRVLRTRSSSNLKMLSWTRLRTFLRGIWNPK